MANEVCERPRADPSEQSDSYSEREAAFLEDLQEGPIQLKFGTGAEAYFYFIKEEFDKGEIHPPLISSLMNCLPLLKEHHRPFCAGPNYQGGIDSILAYCKGSVSNLNTPDLKKLVEQVHFDMIFA
ncbi:hypothetical protein CMI37_26160 [Candidatus Pacearchaeota archaeon]|nr:hypothetical protein [Candidatus Pacearchaeota archaeon]|tara:strand:- start:2550 stop:2927 length:378 start_codon:yes stop_codon:yes gene_type:complete